MINWPLMTAAVIRREHAEHLAGRCREAVAARGDLPADAASAIHRARVWWHRNESALLFRQAQCCILLALLFCASASASAADPRRYPARITRVYDGDTVTADIDLGLGVTLTGQTLRLRGIDAPERRGPDRQRGLAAARHLAALLAPGSVTIETIGDQRGKYGRLIVTIYRGTNNINTRMVRDGHAVAANY